jgi:ATP-binding cassette subfamily B protein
LVVSGLATLVALLALVKVEPVIAGAVAAALAVVALLVLALGPRLQSRTREARRRRGYIAALVNDRIARLAVVETFGQEQREIRRVRRASGKLCDALVERARVVGLLRACAEASTGLAGAAALLVGAMQVAAGLATPGAVVAAMVVAGLLAPRLHELGRVYEYWNAAVVARDKQLQVLRLKPARRTGVSRDKRPLPRSADRLELRDVTLRPLLEHLDLSIDAGARVALLGSNGTGKSTLLRLMAGIIEPQQGAVLLGGRDLRTHRWSDVRRAFAMVSPDLPLLRGSLRLNLAYGLRGASDAALAQVIGHCQLEPLVARLPLGLDTRLSENGEGLSTGERARIAIARALLTQSQVLLLDEADANLDEPSRQALDMLVGSFPGTVVFVTHDASRVAKAGRILTLHDRRVVEVAAGETGACLAVPEGRHIKLVS